MLVLNRFKGTVDFEKYLKHVFAETRVASEMKSTESNNMHFGRMMCMSSCIEAKIFIQGNQANARTLKVIVGCLVELYQKNEFLQESIISTIGKLLNILKDYK